MADDGKRTETICVKVTERVALDLLRLAASDDRSVSEFMYGVIRQRLYGDVARLERTHQITTSDKVYRENGGTE